MKLTLAEPNYLKDSVSIISELVNEASFKIKKNMYLGFGEKSSRFYLAVSETF